MVIIIHLWITITSFLFLFIAMWMSVIIGSFWAEIVSGISIYLFLSFLLRIIVVSVYMTLTLCVIDFPRKWTSIWVLNTFLSIVVSTTSASNVVTYAVIAIFLTMATSLVTLDFSFSGFFNCCFHSFLIVISSYIYIYRYKGLFHWLILYVTPCLIWFVSINRHISIIKVILSCLFHGQQKLSFQLLV